MQLQSRHGGTLRRRPAVTALVTALFTALFTTLCTASFASGAATDTLDPTQVFAASGMKASIAPGDDFNGYVNGLWIDTTDIPADQNRWGIDGQMAEDTDKRVAQLIEDAAKRTTGVSLDERRVGAFYTAFMDEAGIESKGLAPLQPLLQRIAAVNDKAALARMLGSTLRADVDPLNSTNFFTENLFGLWVAQGLHDPEHYQAYLLQGGLGLPDREYYVAKDAKMEGIRAKYVEHIAAVLKLAGFDDADKRAAQVFELERRIARAHAKREDSEDVLKADNLWTRQDFAKKAPGMDWNTFFEAAGLAGQQQLDVWHPGAVKGEAALVAATPLQVWKDYLSYHAVNHFSGVLSKAFADERFGFYGTTLSGTPQQRARWKRAVFATNDALGFAVGHLYVDRYFSAHDKAQVQTMVSNLIAAFDKRIDHLDWMAPQTKAEAKKKLKTLYVGVGYPDHWPDYSGLEVASDDALGNAMRAEEFHYRKELAKFGKPVDKTEWAMVPHIVNAVNMPLQNALNFPAAILQPPSFDPMASDASNYGAIGATIGHEISHSFDDQGAQFDSQGRLRNWWTKGDLAHFKKSSAALAAQFSTYHPFPDLAINGQQTLSENIADLAGLTAALDAYHASLKDPSSADDKAFFISYGASWREKVREKALRVQVVTDGHAPAMYRVSTVRNLDAWYAAFDVKPGQGLYLAPLARVRIW
ncbi:MAG: M13 family metallopeptidase [Burkholderiaceae bacterium]|nr:M13 family metallopeptidase [Burkholderiaceae bacterium]